MIADELRRNHVPDAWQIPLEEVRRAYEERVEVFSSVRQVRVGAVFVESADPAEALLQRAAEATEDEFAALAQRHSMDAASRAAGGMLGWIDHDSADVDPFLVRLALNLKRVGAVGMDRTTDGRYFVLRASQVELSIGELDRDKEAAVRNLLVEERRKRRLTSYSAP